MSVYHVDFSTVISLTVVTESDEIDTAEDNAWEIAEEYLQSLRGNRSGVIFVDATLDGSSHDQITVQ